MENSKLGSIFSFSTFSSSNSVSKTKLDFLRRLLIVSMLYFPSPIPSLLNRVFGHVSLVLPYILSSFFSILERWSCFWSYAVSFLNYAPRFLSKENVAVSDSLRQSMYVSLHQSRWLLRDRERERERIEWLKFSISRYELIDYLRYHVEHFSVESKSTHGYYCSKRMKRTKMMMTMRCHHCSYAYYYDYSGHHWLSYYS